MMILPHPNKAVRDLRKLAAWVRTHGNATRIGVNRIEIRLFFSDGSHAWKTAHNMREARAVLGY